jgi:hypothetical protein
MAEVVVMVLAKIFQVPEAAGAAAVLPTWNKTPWRRKKVSMEKVHPRLARSDMYLFYVHTFMNPCS